MAFNEATFWVGLTVFGSGIYFLIANKMPHWRAWLATLLGIAAMGYSVWEHSHSSASMGLPLWFYLLVFTWVLLGLDVYDRHHGRTMDDHVATGEMGATPDSDFNIEFIPSSGQAEERYLAVKNLGASEGFIAQCRIIARRNDPNPPQLGSHDLQWENGAMLNTLLTGQTGNLYIAAAKHEQGMDSLQLVSAGERHNLSASRWNHGDKLPEYEIEVTVIGNRSNKSQSEKFVVRAGTNIAIEMFKLSEVSIETNPPNRLRDSTFALARELRTFAQQLGSDPSTTIKRVPHESDLELQRRFNEAHALWIERLRSGYKARFEQRVVTQRYLLGEKNLVHANLDGHMNGPRSGEALMLIARTLVELGAWLN